MNKGGKQKWALSPSYKAGRMKNKAVLYIMCFMLLSYAINVSISFAADLSANKDFSLCFEYAKKERADFTNKWPVHI